MLVVVVVVVVVVAMLSGKLRAFQPFLTKLRCCPSPSCRCSCCVFRSFTSSGGWLFTTRECCIFPSLMYGSIKTNGMRQEMACCFISTGLSCLEASVVGLENRLGIVCSTEHTAERISHRTDQKPAGICHATVERLLEDGSTFRR